MLFLFLWLLHQLKNKAKTKTITDLIDAQTKKTAAGKNNLKEIKTSETSENVEQETSAEAGQTADEKPKESQPDQPNTENN